MAGWGLLSVACGSDSRLPTEHSLAACSNGRDDDGDGNLDCADQDCWIFAACLDGGAGSDADTDTDTDSASGSDTDTGSQSDTASESDSDVDTDSDTPTAPEDETCNAEDDDGDGLVDEGDVCPCPSGERGGHAYFVCEDPVDWELAEDSCELHGYALATVDDAAEDAWLGDLAAGAIGGEPTFWIGLNDLEIENTWVWRSSGENAGYLNWQPLEPNDSGGEDCVVSVAFIAGPGWNDYPCWAITNYACETR